MYDCEERNYRRDYRIQALHEPKWYVSFNERTMTAIVINEDDNGNEVERKVKCHYEVCDTCRGTGSHVNPSIDCGGLTSEDFDDDPDFREDYFSGVYDVTCYECNGKRVVPVTEEEI